MPVVDRMRARVEAMTPMWTTRYDLLCCIEHRVDVEACTLEYARFGSLLYSAREMRLNHVILFVMTKSPWPPKQPKSRHLLPPSIISLDNQTQPTIPYCSNTQYALVRNPRLHDSDFSTVKQSYQQQALSPPCRSTVVMVPPHLFHR